MRILQVSTYDKGGGAEIIARRLFEEYRRRGHRSTMVVGEKRTNDPDVIPLAHDSSSAPWGKWSGKLSDGLSAYEGRVRGAWRLRRWLQTYAAHPPNWWQARLGRENFHFPETWKLLEVAEDRPDILHCHNLHGGWLARGGYFDLRALPWLSRQVPTVLTLHDTWLLSGHCAYTLGCDRWKTGCGHCPDLTIYPALSRDGTAVNWKRKQEIFANSRLRIATPSRWLMRQVEQSMLASALVEARVIPNGVDQSVFFPGSRNEAREYLGVDPSEKVLLFVANAARSNVFKDYKTVEESIFKVGASYRRHRITLIVLGEAGESVRFENGEIRFIAFQQDERMTARFYQAADLYVHAAKSDTFPNTVIEALACGLPVVATAVDGIPEQVEEGRTGFLVPPGDAEAMAARVVRLLSHESLRLSMSEAATETAANSFSLPRQVDTYLEWYEQMLSAGDRRRMTAHAC
jgi:glycosyltransferase involved in cell wall biosynthesis